MSAAQRDAVDIPWDDPDLARVKDVLTYYGSAAGYSRACVRDLCVLVKQARGRKAS